ncbi:MAG: YceI family protein [Rubrivivax sp.]|nr:YceI family protein [Rubrivivax sp.]
MHPRRALAIALLALATAAPAAAQPAARLLPEGSEIVFTTRQMGVPVEGRFTRFTAEIALDARQPQAGRVALAIDTASARFGAAELDSEVPRPIWLASAAFPQARFESTAIRAAGGGRFEVAGRLTIKGITRELVVPVTLAAAGAQTLASGSFALKRLDFKVGEAEWSDTSLLADEVQVRFRLRLDGLPLPP